MKNLLVGLLLTLSFIGCSEEVAAPVESKVVVGKSLAALSLNDQFEKKHTLNADTKTVIFAFSKDMGHMSNEFFEKKGSDYLSSHNAVFVADVSGAPSLIRSMFIMPGLKDFKHTVLIIEDKQIAASYRNEAKKEQVMIVKLNNLVIEHISYVSSAKELEEAI